MRPRLTGSLRAGINAGGGLETLADTARRWGLSKTRLHDFARWEGFPTPVGRVASGRVAVYLSGELDDWRANQTLERTPRDVVHRRDEGQEEATD